MDEPERNLCMKEIDKPYEIFLEDGKEQFNALSKMQNLPFDVPRGPRSGELISKRQSEPFIWNHATMHCPEH